MFADNFVVRCGARGIGRKSIFVVLLRLNYLISIRFLHCSKMIWKDTLIGRHLNKKQPDQPKLVLSYLWSARIISVIVVLSQCLFCNPNIFGALKWLQVRKFLSSKEYYLIKTPSTPFLTTILVVPTNNRSMIMKITIPLVKWLAIA